MDVNVPRYHATTMAYGAAPFRKGGRALAGFVASALVATTLVVLDPAAASAAGTVTGTVFRDYNSNGSLDVASGYGEATDEGLSGVTVTAYDVTEAVVGTTTTLGDGTYTLNVSGEVTSDLRVEFSGLPVGYEPSFVGAGAAVQFVEVGDTGVDHAVLVPEEYAQTDAPFVTPIQRAGLPGHPDVTNEPALVTLPWTAGFDDPANQQPTSGSPYTMTYPGRTTIATTGQVGSVWGTAYQGETNTLYAAATLKRHSGVGPLGLGGIYQVRDVLGASGAVNAGGTSVVAWLDVQGQPIVGGGTVDVGSVASNAARGLSGPEDPATDLDGFVLAGEVGIGGLDMSSDGSLLYFVNLYDKNLYAIDVTDPTDSSPDIYRYELGLGVDERPWAVTVYRDQVYVGYVDSGESLATPASAGAAGLAAHVIRADESDLSSWSADLLNFSLGYTKGTAAGTGSPSPTTNLTRWNSWTDEWDWGAGAGEGVEISFWSIPAQVYPQAILSDLQFDAAGYLTLAFADRTSIQGGNRNYGFNASMTDNDGIFYETVASGDILMAYEATPGTFTMESNGVVGARTSGSGVGNAHGPGGGEFYFDAQALGTESGHLENALGGLSYFFGANEIVATTYDPLATVQVAGNSWFNSDNGDQERGYNHTEHAMSPFTYNCQSGSDCRSDDGSFQKGGGLGDVQVLTQLAPLEIGNRVWLDLDNDGLQDAGEPGIDGVTVELYDAGDTLVGTAVTSTDGQYYFATNVSEAAAGDGDNRGGGLEYNETYTIVVGSASDYTFGQPLGEHLLAKQDQTVVGGDAYAGQSDALDSDAAHGGLPSQLGTGWFPEIAVTTGGAGENDHTYDAGFVTKTPVDLALIKTVAGASGPLAGGSATFDLTVINQGSEAVQVVDVTDYITTTDFDALSAAPAGGTADVLTHATQADTGDDVSYAWSIDANPDSTPTVRITGEIAPGESVTVPITLDFAATASMSGLVNHAEITYFDTDALAANGDSDTGSIYDIDSIPDIGNDDELKDDVIDEAHWTNTLDSSSENPGEDEDDHDIAELPLFDLALIKERASGQGAYIQTAAPVTVQFDITVLNQGQETVYNIGVLDTPGTGLVEGTNTSTSVTSNLANSRTVTYSGAGAFAIDQLLAGESVTFTVSVVATAATQDVLVNTAEITSFDNDSSAGNGVPAWVFDVDSTPDSNAANDAVEPGNTGIVGIEFVEDSHNTINLPPVNGVNASDEDDHDTEGVTFGLMRIGSTVYIDADGDNVGDPGEGVQGVLVQLLSDAGVLLDEAVTDADGDYYFTDLMPGDYYVGIPETQDAVDNSLDASINADALTGLSSAWGSAPNPSADNFNDDGAPVSVFATDWLSLSSTVTLTFGEAPVAGGNGDSEDDSADEAAAQGKAAGGDFADANSDLNVDFVFVPYEIGNLVWLDANDNGVQDDGETGLDGIRVELWIDVDNDGVFEPGSGQDDESGFVGFDTTASGGRYSFTNLLADDYFVHIPDTAGNLTALSGLDTSGAAPTYPVANADGDADNDNNAVVDAANGGWTSGAVTLGDGNEFNEPEDETDGIDGANAAVTSSVDDDRSNFTVDFGFAPRVRIGNQVWRDESDADPDTVATTDNNGEFDPSSGEVGLTGVTVELWQDGGAAGFQGLGTDTLIDSVSTDGEGNYWFDDVVPGVTYYVVVPSIGAGFTTPRSSAGQSTANDDADNDDDGNPVGSYLSVSNPLTPVAGSTSENEQDAMPLADGSAETEADGETGPYPDTSSELRVDFGFVDVPLYRIGNRVWLDLDEDGLFDDADPDQPGDEPGIEGVWVQLLDSSNVAIAGAVTDANGFYSFEGLVAGDYRIQIPTDQVTGAPGSVTGDPSYDATALDGLAITIGSGGDPDSDVDDNDNNGVNQTFAWRTSLVTLGASFDSPFGTEPINEQQSSDDSTPDDTDWIDDRSNYTVDFGFIYDYRIGNRVWFDVDNDGVYESTDLPFEDIDVELYIDNGDDVLATGERVGTDTTDANGFYSFEGLAPGTYVVHIPSGQPELAGYTTAGTPTAGANGDVDSDNNAVVDAINGGWTAGDVVLGATSEPTNETLHTGGAGGDDDTTGYPDNASNYSVDFAFFGGLRLGNIVWHDESDHDLSTVAGTDDDGVINGTEEPIEGAVVRLYRDGGNTSFDAGAGDDVFVDSTTTDAEGNYWFQHLAPGNYFVAILSSGFDVTTGGDTRGIESYVSSAGQQTNDDDNEDKGEGATANSLTFVSVSAMVTLSANGEPALEADATPSGDDASAEAEANGQASLDFTADASSNLTVDLGLVLERTYRIGNLVWVDSDADGVAEAGEPGIDGVLVQLLDDGGVVQAEAVTDANGKYAFEDLAPGDYTVRIPETQSTANLALNALIDTAALTNLTQTTVGGAADTDNDSDGDFVALGWESAEFSLGADTAPYDTEPVDERLRDDDATDDDTGWAGGTDDRSQFTIDFGFVQGLRIGDTVWLDDGDVAGNNGAYVPANEDNGVYDANEDPLAGVDVELWIDDGDGVFGDGTDTYAGTDTTDADGEYFFLGVNEANTYFVVIPAGVGDGSGAGNNATLLADLRSSTVATAGTTMGNDTDHGEDLSDADAYAATSQLITPVRGGMSYGDAADEANANGATKSGVTLVDGDSNLVIDFGFSPIPEYEIGNLVWVDLDDDGSVDVGEPGILDVDVQLFLDDGDGVFEPAGDDGAALATDTTDAAGRYEFTELDAGAYWVFIPTGQSELDGLRSSRVRTTAVSDADNDNNAIEEDHDTDTVDDGWLSPLMTVGDGADDHSEPTGEVDDNTLASAEGGVIRDDRANQTVDFGFTYAMRIGNQVWRDESDADPATTATTDNNGVFDAGSGELGIGGVDVELWLDVDGDGFEGAASDDVLIGTTTTDGEGNYWFDGLLDETNYYVAIPDTELAGSRSSAGQSLDPEAFDNDDDGAAATGYVAVSRAVDLVMGDEPAAGNTEADAVEPGDGSGTTHGDAEAEANDVTGETYRNADSQLRVDFGFIEVPLYRVGNLVWLDTDNDGVADVGESPIPGVLVQLFNADGSTLIAETVTDADGHYEFVDLAAGDYRVVIPADQTEDIGGGDVPSAGVLDNRASSTTQSATPNDDTDNDDNGVTLGAAQNLIAAGDFASGTVTLGAGVDDAIGTEPQSTTGPVVEPEVDPFAVSVEDDDAGWADGPDSRSNVTVDFGFYDLLRLGNMVWLDDGGSPYVQADEDDRQADVNEPRIEGVDVELWRDNGDGVFDDSTDTYVGTDVTDADGEYYFVGLTEGDYFAAIPAGAGDADGDNDNAAELANTRSSTGREATDATDLRDQGEPIVAYAAVSNLIELTSGGMTQSDSAFEAGANTKTGVTVPDASSLLTIDFGFSPLPEYALGNVVWYDYDDDGVADSGEPGIVGVDVQLWQDVDLDGLFEPTGHDSTGLVDTDTTIANGRYLFDELAAGAYFVHIPAGQAELTGFRTSGTPTATADSGSSVAADNDNNAVGNATDGWTSGVVVLGDGDDNAEPEGETDDHTGADAEAPVTERDDRSNQTVDFGFFQGLRLGNHVWLDEGASTFENDGVYNDDAGEVSIGNVTVELWLDDGDSVFEPGDDSLMDSTATAAGTGRYYFENLEPGFYWVAVPNVNGSDVDGEDVQSSTNRIANPPSLAVDAQDDGEPNGDAPAYLSVSPLYELTIGGAQTGEVDDHGAAGSAETNANGVTGDYRDTDSFLTVDFGLIDVPLYRVGNLVWFDYDNDGVAESGEPGIPGVLVQLYDDATDTLVGETVTDADGKYAFDDLAEGDVYIVIPFTQDAVDNSLDALIDTDALDGFIVSDGYDSNVNNDQDNDSNVDGGASGWTSGAIRLGPDTAGGDIDVEPSDDNGNGEDLRADDSTDDDSGQASSRIDDDRSNFTIDAGFYSISVGNLVFIDNDNDGVYEPGDGDLGIDGVTVNLRLASDDSLVDTQTTASGGLYLFTGLVDGEEYYIEIPAAEFAAGGGLEGYFSSTAAAGDTEVAETDGEEHGIDPISAYGAVVSATFTADAQGEWTTDGTGDNADNDTVRPDASEDLSVDFAFYLVELGGNVFYDPNNDGQDDADAYYANVTLLLFNGDGSPFLRPSGAQATTTTDASGDYLFTGLPMGDYIVEVVEANFDESAPLEALGSSDGNDVVGFAPDPDNDVSGEDNGDPVGGDLFAGAAVRSAVVTLGVVGEPADDTDPTSGTPDGNSNRTVDFGFWAVQINLEIGNQIWFDDDKDGEYDQIANGDAKDEHPAPNGTIVELWTVDPDTLDETLYDTYVIGTPGVITDEGPGRYMFFGLPAGIYYVKLPAENFDTGGPLHGYVATTGPASTRDVNNGLDSDSNGFNNSPPITTEFIDFRSAMPEAEYDGFVSVNDDRLSDLTIDIGLVRLVLGSTGNGELGSKFDWMLWLVGGGIGLMYAAYRVRPRREGEGE